MSLFNLSENAADSIYTISNVSLVVGALLALTGTLGVFWSGGVRERYANIRLSENSKATAQANAVAARANERAAKIDKEKAELEKSLAPRTIPLIKEGDKTNVDALKPFAGIQMIVRVLPDAEAVRAASNIVALGRQAGWTLLKFEADSELNTGFFDGVVIEPYASRNRGKPSLQSADERRDEERSEAATDAIVGLLTSNNWKARRFPGKHGENSPNTVKISVGFKPSPYFDPQWLKDIEEQ